jgi:hypothetical protein
MSCANLSASTHGAPTSSNGRVVPRASDALVPSNSTVPGYTIAESNVGMLGDGITKGMPVASKYIERVQPSISITCSGALIAKCSLKNRASSPIVMPCRIGIGNWPTNDSLPSTSIGPSTSSPPIGLGRSQTMTSMPCLAQARRQLAIV